MKLIVSTEAVDTMDLARVCRRRRSVVSGIGPQSPGRPSMCKDDR